MQQTCGHSVEEVEHGSENDEGQRQFVISLKSLETGNASRKEVATGNGIRYVADNEVCHSLKYK